MKRSVCVFWIYLLFFLCLMSSVSAQEKEKWVGIDEAVVEKFASEHGREPSEPLINTDQGDLLLFLFLIAGAVGGFVAGYSWRALIEQRHSQPELKKLET